LVGLFFDVRVVLGLRHQAIHVLGGVEQARAGTDNAVFNTSRDVGGAVAIALSGRSSPARPGA